MFANHKRKLNTIRDSIHGHVRVDDPVIRAIVDSVIAPLIFGATTEGFFDSQEDATVFAKRVLSEALAEKEK